MCRKQFIPILCQHSITIVEKFLVVDKIEGIIVMPSLFANHASIPFITHFRLQLGLLGFLLLGRASNIVIIIFIVAVGKLGSLVKDSQCHVCQTIFEKNTVRATMMLMHRSVVEIEKKIICASAAFEYQKALFLVAYKTTRKRLF